MSDIISKTHVLDSNLNRFQSLVSRRFSQPGRNPLDDVKWVRRRAVITEPDGKIVFEMDDVEVPESWSQLATDVLASKYLRKAGVPGTGHETSARQAIERICNAITSYGRSHGYFDDEDADIFLNELAYMLVNQVGAFNSPVWFNVGLWESYGIGEVFDEFETYGDSGGPDHGWYWDDEAQCVDRSVNAYAHPRSAACFILRLEDSLESIFDVVRKEAMIFKYGSGSGLNASRLRSNYEKLSGGGYSSGMMSFLEVMDRGAGSIKSGGTTRRAAALRALDVDHPEIMDFINWKAREEEKARCLLATGKYGDDFNGEAYHTVSGQNANNSVRVTDHFMMAVKNDDEWSTRYRTTGDIHETMPARKIFRAIAESTWHCADPGLQFDTVINDWHTVPNTDRIYASNPCSEYMHLDNSACNLASLNLMKFRREDGGFNVEDYQHAIRTFALAQEILVDYSSYPTEAIAQNSHDYRPLGLGYANLGTLLMCSGLPYDSDEGRATASALTAVLCGEAYAMSAEIAARLGPFAGFAANRRPMLRVISKHRNAAVNSLPVGVMWDVAQVAVDAWRRAYELGEQHGYRNAQMTVLAPAGTIGLLMDCSTTGVEPEFSLRKTKKLAGGGVITIHNQNVERALMSLRVGRGFETPYGERSIESIVGYLHDHGNIEDAPGISPDHLSVFDTAVANKPGGRFIQPMAHIRMLAAVQPFISGAISKTVNCPNSTTVEEIEELYMEAWEHDLKAVALYRDGSKGSQPLNTVVTAPGGNGGAEDLSTAAHSVIGEWGVERPLPTRRKGITIEVRVNGHKLFLRTGEYENGELGEIFIDMYKEGAAYRAMMNNFAIAVSFGLQHGVPLKKYVDKFAFTRFDPYGVTDHPHIRQATSILDVVFRVLALEYLGDSSMVHVPPRQLDIHDLVNEQRAVDVFDDAPPCSDCGHTMVRNGTCYRCLNCGNSVGCS